MYQSGRAGDEAKKRKSPAKSRRVGITAAGSQNVGSLLRLVSKVICILKQSFTLFVE